MRLLWKILIPLALVLPLGAFVAGSLAASAADDPAPRETIVIQDSPTPSPSGDDRGHDEVRVITPSPDDLDDDSDDSGRDGDDGGHGSDDSGGDDDSGHGSDDSGHGGGDDDD